ncbi:MAG TPA: site-specific DNA-methyltransferase [Candidatus Udaeobacter sp.]|nr:site-specific DNA-methyltransferase [Candidatus Udaeobacter sp.]
MAKIEDLVQQIGDERLRSEISAEIRELKKQKRFGLVFEEHLPEMLRLPKAPIRLGNVVAHRDAPGSEVWRVVDITGKKALCRQPINPTKYDDEVLNDFPLDELVLVVSFGEAIYPILTPVDRVSRGGSGKPWHVLINADNYHALQLLLYSHERKVDLIYIDPPYNTGARDWKYNNDYVDGNDSWRHSKWLSMVAKRLRLAKRLLKPDGILVVTIDEHEVHHLGVLLEQECSELARQMVTIVINQKGVAQGRLSRVEEHAMFCFGSGSIVLPQEDDLLSPDQELTSPRWERLLRGGTNSRRADRKKLFFPIYIDPAVPKIKGFGDPLPFDEQPKIPNDKTVAWPLRGDGSLGNWRVKPATLQTYLTKGYVKLGGYDPARRTWTLLYLGRKTQKQIETGAIKIVSRDSTTGAVQLEYSGAERRQIKTVWHRASHDSGNYGSTLLRNVLGEGGTFAFPKSLYSVYDTLKVTIGNRKNAVVLDFFAGSGTTLHATALLNVEQPGSRQCILVTNNEVEAKLSDRLAHDGVYPGDKEFERHGVCESVTWPRCKYALQGHRDDDTELPGEYLNGRPLSDGFEENLEYLRLDFADPAVVERGDAFQGILPILWLIAGAVGKRESRRGSTSWYIAERSPFAVLIREAKFNEFQKVLRERQDVWWVFLVTDSDDNFAAMRRELGRRYRCLQLYKSYLENFRINTVDRHAAGEAAEFQ